MPVNFDQITNRRAVSNLNKWTFYSEDILPLWVADMDFLTPEPIRAALRQALDHGILGYELPGKSLLETVAARLEKLYAWKITPEMIVPTPGVGVGMSAVIRAFTNPADGILVQPPIFTPFIHLPASLGRVPQQALLKRRLMNDAWHYEPDLDSFQKAINLDGAATKLFLLCNPHNPTGRTFIREELSAIGEICLQHNIPICSDEIPHGVLLNRQEHVPIASLSPEFEQNTITFLGPGKTFNMSGLHCAFAIIPNQNLREKVKAEFVRSVLEVNSLGLTAAKAAFSGACDEWLLELRSYLRSNRDFAVNFIATELPNVRTTIPEGTYLLWIDCGELIESGKIAGSPYHFFLEKAKIALTDGEEFGQGGKGFVRLNFACPRPVLEDGLRRMRGVLY